MKKDTNVREAVADIAKSLESVFKKYTRNTREKAWKRITSKDGEKEIDKILKDPSRSLNVFKSLTKKDENNNNNFSVMKFNEWMKEKY